MEQWRTTHVNPGYEVSNLGRVRSIDRIGETRKGVMARLKGKVLRPGLGAGGYYHARLGKDFLNQAVHRLVATAFVPNPEKKPTVNHKNGKKTDNRAENLEWMTHQENTRHGRRVLRVCTGESNGRAKMNHAKIKEILMLRKLGYTYLQLGRVFGICPAQARRICIGEHWKS